MCNMKASQLLIFCDDRFGWDLDANLRLQELPEPPGNVRASSAIVALKAFICTKTLARRSEMR